MGQTTDQIENHIENKREDLKSNLQELESRVKSATDWRHHFDNHPGAMVAAAFGGGVLLSTMVSKGKPAGIASSNGSPMPSNVTRSRTVGTKHQVLETWDTVMSALVGVAATKFKGMLGELVPGFAEHLAKAEDARGRSPASRGSAESIVE
jgi:hypothetical protein